MRWFTVGLAVLLLPAVVASAAVTLNPSNGHYYEFVSGDPIDWLTAKAMAESMSFMGADGYLVTITSAEENAWLSANFFPEIGHAKTWAGGYQDREAPDFSEPAGGWRWVTGEPWEFTAWVPGEPNNRWVEPEDHLEIGFPHNPPEPGDIIWWNDYDGHDGLPWKYVVEYSPIPEPAALIIWSLLGGLAITVGWWRKRRCG